MDGNADVGNGEPEEDRINTSWIKENIHLITCVQFVLDEEANESDNDPKCGCGLKKSDHEECYKENKGSWDPETHTVTSATDAYGKITFFGSGSWSSLGQKPHKFVRVDSKTETETLLQLLNREWHLGPPKLLISVTGGASNFKVNRRLQDIFEGIIKAAASTGAWIITGGTNCGVMKYIGEAVKDEQLANSKSNIRAIGIATWGVLDQKDQMKSAKHSASALLSTTKQCKEADGRGILLDPNHTHFILVDNGTLNQFGAEIELRSRLEKGLSTQNLEEGMEGMHVPIVCVVVNGGLNTINTVSEAVKNGTPVVIVANSGRAADVLSFAYHNANMKNNEGNTNKEAMNDQSKEKIAKMLLDMELPESKLVDMQFKIEQCLQRPHLYNVFDLDSGVDIVGAVLRALWKANKKKKKELQLKLAQTWNRADIAEEELFRSDTVWEDGELNKPMRYALLHNQDEFVRLFLENGLNLKNYLTRDELEELYDQPEPGSILESLLARLKKKKKIREKLKLQDIGELINDLTMDTYTPAYSYRSTSANFTQEPTFENPMRELFIYAVLNKYDSMSRLFWEEGSQHIAAALTASMMLMKMATYRTWDIEKEDEIVGLSKEYERLARGVLKQYYGKDKDQTALILQKTLPNWGNATCLNLAVAARNKNFIADSGVQNVLSNIWLGQLTAENYTFLLWLCTLCPPLIPFVVKFRGDGEEDDVARTDLNESVDTERENVQMLQRNSSVGSVGDDCGGVDKGKDSGKVLTPIQRLKSFYDSPMIRFRHNAIADFFFLVLFSYVVLSNKFKVPRPGTAEIFLITWVFTLFIEECRQIVQEESQSFTGRIKHWFFDHWNQVDLAALIMFATGVSLRFSEQTLEAARIILALDLFIFFIRLLNIFTVFRKIGPKLVMIKKMFRDLSFFICILFVFMLGYGITVQSILYPHVTSGSVILEGILYRPYFQIYGELFLDDIRPEEGCSATDPDCPAYPEIGILLLAGYMIISNVLLLNLLIAMFSYTFGEVQDKTDIHWRFQRYELTKEYVSRPSLVPPFIIISHATLFVRWLLHKCQYGRHCMQWEHSQFEQITKEEETKLVRWARCVSKEFIAEEKERKQLEIKEQVKGTGDRVKSLLTTVEHIFADTQTENSSNKRITTPEEKALQERLNKLEDRLGRNDLQLGWIINALAENKLSAKTGLPELKEIQPREEAS